MKVVHLLGGLQVVAVGTVAPQLLLEELGGKYSYVVVVLEFPERLLARLLVLVFLLLSYLHGIVNDEWWYHGIWLLLWTVWLRLALGLSLIHI